MKALMPRGLLAVLVVAACTKPPDDTPKLNLNTTPGGDVLPIDHPPITAEGGGSAQGGGSANGGGTVTGGGPQGGGTPDGGTPVLVTMATRRLSVMQLQRSLPVVLGGNTWQINGKEGFGTRAGSLGAADYISVMQDNLEPSPVYLKFMGDAARDGCNRTLTADAALPQGQQVLTRFVGSTDTVATQPAKIDQNLRYLRLRFHGIKVAATDDQPIAHYRQLFTDAYTAQKGVSSNEANAVKEGWRAVCVALLTAPEYHLY